jgi:acyl-CoA thioesterase II
MLKRRTGHGYRSAPTMTASSDAPEPALPTDVGTTGVGATGVGATGVGATDIDAVRVDASLDVRDLLALFTLEALGGDRFLAPNPPSTHRFRLYGGQVAAQALMAAALTVPRGRRPHSIHCYFLRGGRHDVPATHDVQRVRDGRSFSVRRVIARQDGEEIFTAACSFHVDEPGVEHQATELPEGVEAPEEIPEPPRIGHNTMFEVREFPAAGSSGAWVPPSRIWVRTRGPMPDDDLLNTVAVCYLSDMGWAFGSLVDGGGPSIDHAVWFHRAARADEWLLLDLTPVAARGARGVYLGTVHERSGAIVATLAQEALIRQRA